MSYDTALIECVSVASDIFPNAKKGDIVFYPLNKTQKILIGTEQTKDPCITIQDNKLGLQTPNPKFDVHITGHTMFDGNINMKDTVMKLSNGKMLFCKRNGVLHGGLSFSNKYHGVMTHQIADKMKLNIEESTLTPKQSLNILKQIPVHNLSEKTNEPDQLPSLGCLAHEVETLYAPCVSQINNTRTIDYTKLIPLLIKGIQEINLRLETIESM